MNTFLFYDIETTGLDRSFDQTLQFAAIRTDMNLHEIERHNIVVRLRPDAVYSPRAIITSRISIKDSMEGICEYEAARQIHGMLNEFGTISIGYNSLGFDDEVLRFTFHRNLLQPYTHQYNNGCRRMDLFPMTIVYRLYKDNVITWPEIDGKPSLKLEYISSANRLAEGQAHDAMVDVEATLELARRFIKEKETWEYLDSCFIKANEKNRIADLPVGFENEAEEHRLGVLVSGEFGTFNGFQAPALFLGNSAPYSNQMLWLRLDLPDLRETTDKTIDENTWVIRKRLAEPPIILPPREHYWDRLGKERCETAKENIRWLKSHPSIFDEIISYHKNFKYPELPDLDPDAALYQNGFLSRREQELCLRFHEVPLDKKAEIAGTFPSPMARELAGRILCRNYQLELPRSITDDFKKYMEKINPGDNKNALINHKGDGRTTPADAAAEIGRIRNENSLDEEQLQLLNELEQYIAEMWP